MVSVQQFVTAYGLVTVIVWNGRVVGAYLNGQPVGWEVVSGD